MSELIEYRIVEAVNVVKLSSKVQVLLQSGWKLYGSPYALVSKYGHTHNQAVTKEPQSVAVRGTSRGLT